MKAEVKFYVNPLDQVPHKHYEEVGADWMTEEDLYEFVSQLGDELGCQSYEIDPIVPAVAGVAANAMAYKTSIIKKIRRFFFKW